MPKQLCDIIFSFSKEKIDSYNSNSELKKQKK